MIKKTLNQEQYEFLTYVRKGKDTAQIKEHYGKEDGSDFLQWGNGYTYIAQNPVTKKYNLTLEGKQAMDYYVKYVK